MELPNCFFRFGIATFLAAAIFASDARAGEAEVPGLDPAVAAAMRTGSYKDAARLLEKRAKAGDREAQYQLAALYRAGRGVEQDDTIAFKWMHSAAMQGHAKARSEYTGAS